MIARSLLAATVLAACSHAAPPPPVAPPAPAPAAPPVAPRSPPPRPRPRSPTPIRTSGSRTSTRRARWRGSRTRTRARSARSRRRPASISSARRSARCSTRPRTRSRTSRAAASTSTTSGATPTHPRGLWRRTTLAEYRKAAAARGRCVLDLDALGEAENENWVWHGADVPASPHYERCLVSLSRGGADADVVREFDVATQEVRRRTASRCPRPRASVGWIDADSRLRRHRLRPRLDDHVRLPAHRQGVEARHAARATRHRVYEGKPTTSSVERRRATTRRASSATSSSRAIDVLQRASRTCARRTARCTQIDVPRRRRSLDVTANGC